MYGRAQRTTFHPTLQRSDWSVEGDAEDTYLYGYGHPWFEVT